MQLLDGMESTKAHLSHFLLLLSLSSACLSIWIWATLWANNMNYKLKEKDQNINETAQTARIVDENNAKNWTNR